MAQVRLTTATIVNPGTGRAELEILATTRLPNGKTLTARGADDATAVRALGIKVAEAKALSETKAEYPKIVQVQW